MIVKAIHAIVHGIIIIAFVVIIVVLVVLRACSSSRLVQLFIARFGRVTTFAHAAVAFLFVSRLGSLARVGQTLKVVEWMNESLGMCAYGWSLLSIDQEMEIIIMSVGLSLM